VYTLYIFIGGRKECQSVPPISDRQRAELPLAKKNGMSGNRCRNQPPFLTYCIWARTVCVGLENGPQANTNKQNEERCIEGRQDAAQLPARGSCLC